MGSSTGAPKTAAHPPSLAEIRATLGILAAQVLRAGLSLPDLRNELTRELMREASGMGLSASEIAGRLGVGVRRVFDFKKDEKTADDPGEQVLSVASVYVKVRRFCGTDGRTFDEILARARKDYWLHGRTRRDLTRLLDAMTGSEPPMLEEDSSGDPIVYRMAAARTRFRHDAHQALSARYVTLMRSSSTSAALEEGVRYASSLYLPIRRQDIPELMERMRDRVMPSIKKSISELDVESGDDIVHLVLCAAPTPEESTKEKGETS